VNTLSFDKGYLAPYFVTNPERGKCIYEDVYVLIHDKTVSSIKDLLPVLESVSRSGKPLLIIAEEVQGEVLATLIANKIRGTLKCVAVNAPGEAILRAIAILSPGRTVHEDLGVKLKDATLMDLGYAKRVRVDTASTTIEFGSESKIEN
jgi:chaperonin GroEL